MKKGPLSKKEKAYIVKNYLDATSSSIASDMDRSIHIVDKHIATLPFDQKEKPIKQEAPAQVTVKAGDLFARNKKQGVTVMTEAASSKGDTSREFNRTPPHRQRGMIHVIKKD